MQAMTMPAGTSHDAPMRAGSSSLGERAAALRAQVEELARNTAAAVELPKRPRAEGKEGKGGKRKRAKALPPMQLDEGQKLPMLISSTELGVYVKWALMLQDMLRTATCDYRRWAQHRMALLAENSELQAELLARKGRAVDNPIAACELEHPTQSACGNPDLVLTQMSSCDDVCKVSDAGNSAASTATEDEQWEAQQDTLMGELTIGDLLRSPPADPADPLLTPNLARLADALDTQSASLFSLAWPGDERLELELPELTVH